MSEHETPENTEGTYEPPSAEVYEAPEVLIEAVIEQDVLNSGGGGGGPGLGN